MAMKTKYECEDCYRYFNKEGIAYKLVSANGQVYFVCKRCADERAKEESKS